MCPTIAGRVQSRICAFPLPTLLALLLSVLTGRWDWMAMIGLMLAMGIALDALVYPRLISYQPPWLTGVIGLAELGYLFVLVHLAGLQLAAVSAVGFYVAAWALATGTRIAIFPIASLTYLESAGEFRRVRWTIAESQQQVPVLATVGEAGPLLGGLAAPDYSETSAP